MANNVNGDSAEWRKWAHQVLTYLVDHTKAIDRFVEEQRRQNDRVEKFMGESDRRWKKSDHRIARMIQELGRHDADIRSLKRGRS